MKTLKAKLQVGEIEKL